MFRAFKDRYFGVGSTTLLNSNEFPNPEMIKRRKYDLREIEFVYPATVNRWRIRSRKHTTSIHAKSSPGSFKEAYQGSYLLSMHLEINKKQKKKKKIRIYKQQNGNHKYRID